jgi:predicted XRE-type DNA-binding protein
MKSKSKTQRRQISQPGHVTRGDVLDDLFSHAESSTIKLKMQMHKLIVKQAKDRELSREKLEEMFETSQPRVCDLMNGKLAKFSLEMLIAYADKIGIHSEEIRIKVPDTPLAYA